MAQRATRLPSVSTPCVLLAFACCMIGARADAGVQGRAFAAYVNMPAEGVYAVTLVDSGDLPVTGGIVGDSAAVATAGSVLRLVGPASRSEGDGCRGSSRSVMAAGTVLAGSSAQLTFDGISSHDDDECCDHDRSTFITSDVANLVFAGTPVTVTGQPNQVVTIPGVGTLYVNEVILMGHNDCEDDDYQVNALHLQLADGGQVIVGSVRFDSDDDCCATPSKTSSWGRVKVRYR